MRRVAMLAGLVHAFSPGRSDPLAVRVAGKQVDCIDIAGADGPQIVQA